MTSWERRKENNGFTELQRPDKEREETGNIDIIKDMTGKILFKDELINAIWVEYFEELLNVENEREEMTDVSLVDGTEKELELQEVREAMKRMKNNRTPGVSEVSIDMVKAGEESDLDDRIAESSVGGREYSERLEQEPNSTYLQEERGRLGVWKLPRYKAA